MKTGKPITKTTKKYQSHGHNILVEAAQDVMSGKSVATIPSQKSMGGSHNVAMAVLTEQSRQFKQKRAAQQAKTQSPFSAMFSARKPISDKQY